MQPNAPVTSIAAAPRWFLPGVLCVVAATLLAFSPALSGPFVYDDFQAVRDNPSIVALWPLSVPLHPPPGTTMSGRPVVNLTLAISGSINRALGGAPDATFSHHLFNLLLHVACGLLLLGIVRRTLSAGRVGDWWRDHAREIALVVVAFWLLHPLQTDAVDYITQRTEVVVSFWYLTTLYCAIRAWDADSSALRARWFGGGVLACALGMGSKEVMVSAPIMVLLYDRAFRLTTWRGLVSAAAGARRWFYAALAGTWAILAALLAGRPRGASVGNAAWMSPLEYLHTQGWAVAHYLRLAFFPDALSIDYDFRAVEHWRGLPGLLLLTGFGILTLLAWRHANRWGWFAFAGSWFFLILAPSSSVVPILTEPVAERRMYLPLAAVIVLVVVGVVSGWRRFAPRVVRRGSPAVPARMAASAAVLLAFLLLGVTWQRSQLYRDPEALWRDATRAQPDDPRAWVNLGATLATETPPRRAEADAMFRAGLALDSLYPDALLNVAIDQLDAHDYAAAEPAFRRMLSIDSTNTTALGGLATLLLARGDTAAALPYLTAFTRRSPGVQGLVQLALAELATGNEAAAEAALHDALGLDPGNEELRLRVAGTLIEAGHARQAGPLLAEAVRRDPGSGISWALLSVAQMALGATDSAVAAAAHAAATARGNPQVFLFAGRAMLVGRRTDLAAQYIGEAARLAPRDPEVLTYVGEAALAAGRRADAIAAYRAALQADGSNAMARDRLKQLGALP